MSLDFIPSKKLPTEEVSVSVSTEPLALLRYSPTGIDDGPEGQHTRRLPTTLRTVKRQATRLVAVLLLTVGAVIAVTASPAAAADGNMYVVAPDWWGWCPGSSVAYMSVSNSTEGSWGSVNYHDVVRISYRAGMANHMSITVRCANSNSYQHRGLIIWPGPNGGAVFINRWHSHWANW